MSDCTLRIFAVSMLVAIMGAPTAHASNVPNYKLVQTAALGSPDRWDYVVFDDATHRVFVSHGDRVSVVDGHDATVLGEVEGFPGGTHGIAISSATGHGYTDDGHAGAAASFDLTTFKVIKSLQAQEDADGTAFDPSSNHVFASMGILAS